MGVGYKALEIKAYNLPDSGPLIVTSMQRIQASSFPAG
jgi:hypothetical protein